MCFFTVERGPLSKHVVFHSRGCLPGRKVWIFIGERTRRVEKCVFSQSGGNVCSLGGGVTKGFGRKFTIGFLLFGPQIRSDGYRMNIGWISDSHGWISDGWWIGIFVPDGPTVCFLSLASRARASTFG